MKWIFSFLLFSNVCLAQKIDTVWNDRFSKEIHIFCAGNDNFCESVCFSYSACYLAEPPCRNCIGTNLQMHHIFSEIGRSIHRTDLASRDEVTAFFKAGDYVSFSAKDVFNIIDSHNSQSLFRKFESLCPEGSIHQILFFSTHKESRKILLPKILYCEFDDSVFFFKVEDKVLIDRYSLPLPLGHLK